MSNKAIEQDLQKKPSTESEQTSPTPRTTIGFWDDYAPGNPHALPKNHLYSMQEPGPKLTKPQPVEEQSKAIYTPGIVSW